ncbi:MAG: cytochrome c [Myxococcales bacterium]|nr:cytochrome c [Myxococcales bacterium]
MSRSLHATLGLAMLTLAGCQGQTSTEPPIVPIRNMHEQPRYDAQEAGRYFTDGRAMRPAVPHTVAREMQVDAAIETGVNDDFTYVQSIDAHVVEGFEGGMAGLVARGEERYGIYCVPCHGGLGDGNGMIPEVSGVATIRPPSFHDDRIRHMPDGQMYATIRNGLRNMPAYGHSIPVRDRWAIVGYVRALQLSQMDGQ